MAGILKRCGLVLCLLMGAVVQAQVSIGDVVQRAQEAYEAGDYDLAISLYDALVQAGFRDGALFMNVGNAYYAVGDLGRAMLSYRRAQEIIPRDGDLNLNLARVRTRRINIQGDESALVDSLTVFTQGIMTVEELTWLVFLSWSTWFVMAAGWLLRVDWRARLQIPVWMVGGVLLVLGLLLGVRLYVNAYRPAGVVIAPLAIIRSGPGEDYLEHHRIYAGAELRVLETRSGWVRFTLPDGRQGWIPADSVETVTSYE